MGANHATDPGHSGHPTAPPAPPRLRRLLAAIVLPLFALSVAGAVWFWPAGDETPVKADSVTRYDGTVRAVLVEECPTSTEPGAEPGTEPGAEPGSAEPGPCGTVTVRVEDGPDAGREVTTPVPAGPGAPTVEVGDQVVLIQLVDPEDGKATYTIADHRRGRPLILLTVLFAAAIVGFGRLRGLAALGGLAASFAILLAFVLPAIRAGESPLPVAIVGASLIMFVVLYLTHGITTQTSVAVLGTLASLVLTGLLGSIATAVTHLTGYGTEEASTLAVYQNGIDLHGLLLAGIIIGSLGVLDDVTVTQAATVTELSVANPNLSGAQLYRAATRVGRAHIASTVNTIVLAYAGASLPALLLIIASGTPVGTTLTTEFIAQEIVRSAVATMGLVAAVPITTGLAALVTARGRRAPRQRPAAPGGRPPEGDSRRETWAALSNGVVADPWQGPKD